MRILAKQTPGTAPMSPLFGKINSKIQEILQAILQVELLENIERIFEGTARNTGLEVAGAIEILTI